MKLDECGFCILHSSYILHVPFDTADLQGIVYVWIGRKAEHSEATIAEEIAYDIYGVSHVSQKYTGNKAVDFH